MQNRVATIFRGYQIKGDVVIAGNVDGQGEQLSIPDAVAAMIMVYGTL